MTQRKGDNKMFSSEKATLQYVAFQMVASTIDELPIYSVADIIEPLVKYRGKLLRYVRKTAGPRGYVLVGRAGLEWPEFEATSRRVNGIY